MPTIRQALLLLLFVSAPATAFAEETGILLLAHGGNADWNRQVLALAAKVNRTKPVEVAFGMAARGAIQAAVDRLAARGVSRIVAVPLFVSSWSSIMTSTEYLLGLRADAPPELAIYAGMEHAHGAGTADKRSPAGHDHHAAEAISKPIASKVPIARMTAALNAHPIVAQILTTRARSISHRPSQEAVIIVAHGPVDEEMNRRWLADMQTVAAEIAAGSTVDERFASIDYMTVRDDAPETLRNAVTAEFRALVSRRIAENRRVLIVPLLLSFGGIEKGVAARLDGLAYTMTSAGLMPDDRLADWVLESVGR